MSSGGMTKLSDKAMYMGSSGGGYAAVAASDKFQSYGIMPVKVLAGAAPLKGLSWTALGFTRSLLAGKLGPFDALHVAVVGLSLSNTRPGYSNYNTAQTFLKPDRVDNSSEMLTDLDAQHAIFPDLGAAYFGTFVTKYPENFSPDTQYLSDNTVRFFETALANGDEDPCVNATLDLKSLGMDVLCDELNEVDLRDVVVGADYPIELCHSKTDALVDSENVPDAYLLKYELDGLSHSASVPTCQVKMFEGTELNKKATVLRATKSPKASKASKAPKATKAPKASKSRKGLR